MGLKDVFERFMKGGPLIHVDFHNLRDIFKKINIKIFSDNKIEVHHHYDERTNTLSINTVKLSVEEKQELGQELRSIIAEGGTLIESKADEKVKDIIDDGSSSEILKIVNFFQQKVPQKDLYIIIAALHIRKCFRRGDNIGRLKIDVIQKHGQRGNNIVNLCSANYFEEYFLPLYDYLKVDITDHKKLNDEFYSVFDRIVEELPFTIFVSQKMSKEDVKAEILEKIENNKQYGIKFLNIHGIGKFNVQTIQETINELESKEAIKNIVADKKREIFHVRLGF